MDDIFVTACAAALFTPFTCRAGTDLLPRRRALPTPLTQRPRGFVSKLPGGLSCFRLAILEQIKERFANRGVHPLIRDLSCEGVPSHADFLAHVLDPHVFPIPCLVWRLKTRGLRGHIADRCPAVLMGL